ncbi:lysophospholipid acyltransferase family protein [Lacticaseibacillus yichunensis]|uniref:Lysophospholipid acyltransferase family protein n=1 Tax=Lacticaseibacillus yichunensis TaxID=2486015 RepID=A0ABW4CPK7_9LACO|nr:acyl-phosphate glycerol 3-phosphate acyltransferase [Lacticaseibacillus yichunensis]
MAQQKPVLYYDTLQDDIVTSANQDFQLAADFSWLRDSFGFRLGQRLVYPTARRIGSAFWRTRLAARFVGRAKLTPYADRGYFLYGNHTQTFGDPLLPMVLAGRKQIVHTIASPANLGMPVIGGLLPYGNALILPQSTHQMGEFYTAIEQVIASHKAVGIFPEAHLWPWYTQIRPFSDSVFHYPVAMHAPSFCFTTTYQRHHVTVYVDGPFWPEPNLPRRAQQRQLRDEIARCMTRRSQHSTYSRIDYRRRSE